MNFEFWEVAVMVQNYLTRPSTANRPSICLIDTRRIKRAQQLFLQIESPVLGGNLPQTGQSPSEALSDSYDVA